VFRFVFCFSSKKFLFRFSFSFFVEVISVFRAALICYGFESLIPMGAGHNLLQSKSPPTKSPPHKISSSLYSNKISSNVKTDTIYPGQNLLSTKSPPSLMWIKSSHFKNQPEAQLLGIQWKLLDWGSSQI
jgi:hypothetical protein